MTFTFCYCVLCGVVLVQVLLMLLHAIEHRRYHRVCAARSTSMERMPFVSLFVPCKGTDLEIDQNLRALFVQDYRSEGGDAAYEICLIVESLAEPAAAVFESLRIAFPQQPCRVVVSGPARDCGQKVYNLKIATLALPSRTEVLAFADADARPHASWLRRMVQRVLSGKQSVCTGYRWLVPLEPTFANRLIAASNNWLTTLTSCHGLNLIWGGSWVITRAVYERLGLPEAWQGAVSDDLVASRLLRNAGERIAYEPWSLVTSPVNATWKEHWSFLRRQYVVAAVCVPGWWWSGLLATALGLAMLVVSTVFTVSLARRGDALWFWPLVVGSAYYLANVFRVSVGIGSVQPFLRNSRVTPGQSSGLMAWGWPVISSLHLAGLLAGRFGRIITWRGIQYRLLSPTKTEILRAPD